MIAAVAALAADERGVLLGLLRGGFDGDVGVAQRLAGPGAERCRAALAEVTALDGPARTAAEEALVAELAASVPAGLERVHPGWLRRVLETEPTAILRAVVRGLPEDVARVVAEIVEAIVRARGVERADLGHVPESRGLVAVRRMLFAALAPLPRDGQEGNAGPPRMGVLCALPFAALLDELDRRGATALGLALGGAPDAALARAAAGVGEPLARFVLAAARGPGATVEARAEARACVASVPADEAARGAARAVGLRVVAREVAPEGPAALAAVAQRLPPDVGDALVACAGPARVWG